MAIVPDLGLTTDFWSFLHLLAHRGPKGALKSKTQKQNFLAKTLRFN